MAGDWIKYRAELRTHPRFLALHSALMRCEYAGLPTFATTSEARERPVGPDEDVADAVLRFVTEEALRCVTLVTLLNVWSAVNAHCKVSGNDAVMNPMTVFDIDAVAGFIGFGGAMLSSGWAREASGNSLVFPNFLDWNEPVCVRRREPMSGAERVRRHRAKRAAEGDNDPVTPVTKRNACNDREEKRREENTNPQTPLGICKQITDPKEAAALVLAEEGRWMPADWPHLDGPARRIEGEYRRLVKTPHRQGRAVAALVKILAHGVSEGLLMDAARRYGESLDRQDAAPVARQGAWTFFGEDGWRLWLQAPEPAAAPPPPPKPAPKLSAEERKAVAELMRKDREGRSDA